MFKDLSDEQKNLLVSEQNEITNATDKLIVVSARPGCGKTFTLVEKIKKDAKRESIKRGFIACSFTREASKQLENKLSSQNVDLSLSFVGTIDSFVLSAIVDPFKKRCSKYLFQFEMEADELIVTMPSITSKPNQITKTGKTHPEVDTYYDQWISNFLAGKYEISYCAYKLAVKMITEMPEVKAFLSTRFFCIYVDEAQDLNEFQHDLILALKDVCMLNIVLIGDKNQSIYEFRGAKPELFMNLVHQGYTQYPISVSVRCHKSIMDFSNLFIGAELETQTPQDIHVFIHETYSITELKQIIENKENILWLCESKDFAQKFLNFSNDNNYGFVYTKPLELNDSEFVGTYNNLLEEVLKFYYNYKNPIPNLTYSIDDFELVLLDYVTENTYKSMKKIIVKTDVALEDYIKNIFSYFGVNLSDNLLLEIVNQLNVPACLQHYKHSDTKRRIMTIHGSKGLEAKNVIIFIDYEDYFYNTRPSERFAKFRSYYVGFSRAEEELHIFYCTKKKLYGKEKEIIQNAIKTKIKESYNKLSHTYEMSST